MVARIFQVGDFGVQPSIIISRFYFKSTSNPYSPQIYQSALSSSS